MAVTTAQFREHLAGYGYECFDNTHVQRTLNYASTWCPADCWGARRDDGVCWLAAHLMSDQISEVSQLAAAGAQAAEGKQFSPRTPFTGTSDDQLRKTMAGNEYLRLRTLVVGLTAAVVGI